MLVVSGAPESRSAGRGGERPEPGPEATGTSVVNDTIAIEPLRRHVAVLGGEIGERNIWHPQALRRAADYIRGVWAQQGHTVSAQEYNVNAEPWANLEVTVPGTALASQIVLVGAHYDSVQGSPGANDNGTGVAALLELTRCLAHHRPRRTLRFVAFVNEEPPLFWTRAMGSQVYARAARGRGDDIRAMLALETLGYYSDAPGSQHYPPFFSWFYPDRGNFIGFVSNWRSRALLKRSVAAFRAASDFPVESLAAPAFVPGVGWSDQLSFWQAGYAGIMVTDTAPYRYPWYHSAQDTPDKIDYAHLARVTQGLCGAIAALADADEL
jgi:Zn-dependent M28 family amino/carboxypeptidase